MKKLKKLQKLLAFSLCLVLLAPPVRAEELADASSLPTSESDASEQDTTLVFNNTDIRDVLRLIADEYNLNMVMSDDVTGAVTLRLRGASLQNTLDAILAGRGYDYDIVDNIIRVGKTETIQGERNQRSSRLGQEPLETEVLVLKYLDANDLKDFVKSMLTKRGRVEVLASRPYRGFRFGTQSSSSAGSASAGGGSGALGAFTGAGVSSTGSTGRGVSGGGDVSGLIRARDEDDQPRSNTMMIVDIRTQIQKIKETIAKVDIQPRQILIDTKILEVNPKTLEDLGFDLQSNLHAGGTENTALTDINSGASQTGVNTNILGNTFPSNSDAGIHTVFTKLRGEDLTVTLHALAQDSRTKTLSSPRILTIENQEAAILVGEQFPIFQSSITDQGTTTESLSYFQPIGISLQVVAQVTPNNEISMIVHPTVSSLGAFVTGTSGLTQPRINTREADTRVLIKNGETLVIGGLLQDENAEKYFSVPVLDHVPVLGRLFSRRQKSVDQRNLLIFITPRIVKPGGKSNLTEAERETLKGIQDPARYGYLNDRRKMIDKIYAAGKKNYKEGRFDAAKANFKQVLALDQENRGAISYLKKMNALPVEKPIS